MNHARAELAGGEQSGRGFRRGGPTTWLRYVSFRHRPTVPTVLDAFLEPCLNRTAVLGEYAADPTRWGLAVRVRLPLGGWWAVMLTPAQADWLTDARRQLTQWLQGGEPGAQFATVAQWRACLPLVPVPMWLADRLESLLPADACARHTLAVGSALTRLTRSAALQPNEEADGRSGRGRTA